MECLVSSAIFTCVLITGLHAGRDPVRAPGDKGAEEHYDLSDALGVSGATNTCIF